MRPVDSGPESTRARILALVLVALILGLGAWAGPRLRVITDIRHFLPIEEGRGWSEVSAALADSPLTRSSVLLVEAEEPVAVAQRLAAELREHPEVEWVRAGIDQPLEAALHELYFPRRAYLSRPDVSDAGLARHALELQQALAGPRGPLVRAMAAEDPLLSFVGFLEGLREGDGTALETRDGQLVTADGEAAVLFVRTRSSAFAAEPQARFQADLSRALETIRAELDPSATVSQSGLARFAIAAERSTISDITRVSIASTFVILVLFLVLFGQLRALLLTYAPVVLGVVGGILGCSLLLGEVHGLTLAFGSALLGVGVDYAVHLMFHLGHRGAETPAQVVARVRQGLLLGAATTVIGLAGLALTSFPGMRELALFGAVGIGGSLLVTLVVVPAYGARLPELRVRRWLVGWARGVLARLDRWRAGAWVMFAAMVLAGIAGLVTLRWNDGLRALYEADAALFAEDARVRERTGGIDMSRMVLATGASLEQALERNDAVYVAVRDAVARGELAGHRSVQPWLPSLAWQRESLQRLRDPTFAARFDAAFEAAGFRSGAFAPFFRDLAAPPAPLSLSDLRGTPLGPIVEPFVLKLQDGSVVVITWLRGAAPASLRDELGTIPGVELFDQQEFLDRTYGRYRVEMIRMLLVGLVGVVAIVFWRYRRWRPTAAAFLPAVAGAMGAVAATAWIDGSANLVHAASLLLVCSMGVDYGVFMVETHDDPERHAVSLASSLLAGVTTVLSFGLLAMSSNPALASVGRSLAIGVACALVTAPVTATLLGGRRSS